MTVMYESFLFLSDKSVPLFTYVQFSQLEVIKWNLMVKNLPFTSNAIKDKTLVYEIWKFVIFVQILSYTYL